MTTFKQVIEAAYPGNLGFVEMFRFQQVATPSQKKELDRVANADDWDGYTTLIQKVLGTKLRKI